MSLQGPAAAPASGQAAQQLVVLLHGLGADGDDLFDLVPFFAAALPDAAFIAPHAPQPCDMIPMGRQWFSLQDLSPPAIAAGIEATAPVLNAFLDAELSRHGLTDSQLLLVGFSQGTMMALHVALRRPHSCAAVIGYSGLLAATQNLPNELRSRPPVLLVHGDDDEVVAPGFMPMARDILERLGVPVLTLPLAGLGHGINDEGVKAGVLFARQQLGG